MPDAPHLVLGRLGEDAVARYYRRRGYRVLARNWRCPAGELDLILVRLGQIVVCEVKTRTSTRFGRPADAVDATKQRRILHLVGRWRAESGRRGPVRIDVAEVLAGEITVRRRAFGCGSVQPRRRRR